MLEGLSEAFFEKFKEMQNEGYEPIIVHGGGPAINKALNAQGVESSVLNGIRVTSKEAIGIVQSILIGQVNPALVHHLNRQSIEAIGLSGFDSKLLTCNLLDLETYGYVGDIQSVNVELLNSLLMKGLVPVISCIGATAEGEPLNINADTVASEVALAIGAESLLLVTDTPGIKINDEQQKLVNPSAIHQWIETGDIYGGMIPKVQAAIAVLNEGIPSVQIVDQHLAGTVITNEEVLA